MKVTLLLRSSELELAQLTVPPAVVTFRTWQMKPFAFSESGWWPQLDPLNPVEPNTPFRGIKRRAVLLTWKTTRTQLGPGRRMDVEPLG